MFWKSSVQFSHSVTSDSLQPHGLQHARLPCSSPTPGACSNSCPLCWWCHPTILSSVVPFSSCLQSFPASKYFPMNQFFTSGGQSIGVSASASVLPVNIQDWFLLRWTGLISLQSKGPSRVFSNTTVQKHNLGKLEFQFSSVLWDTDKDFLISIKRLQEPSFLRKFFLYIFKPSSLVSFDNHLDYIVFYIIYFYHFQKIFYIFSVIL